MCWEKFCNYFDVELCYVFISEEYKMFDGYDFDRYVDENMIGVVVIMGVIYIGMYELVVEIVVVLDVI